MRVCVASKNPVKCNAARLAIEQCFPSETIEVDCHTLSPDPIKSEILCAEVLYLGEGPETAGSAKSGGRGECAKRRRRPAHDRS